MCTHKNVSREQRNEDGRTGRLPAAEVRVISDELTEIDDGGETTRMADKDDAGPSKLMEVEVVWRWSTLEAGFF